LAGPGSADQPGTARWRLTFAYDGRAFRGFAAQPGTATVAGSLAEALARTLRLDGPPALVCAGRTDAGVHARGQVVHVDLPEKLPPGRSGGSTPLGPAELVRRLNRQLAPAVVVHEARPAPGFDARRAATSRHYRYLVWNAPFPDPLLDGLVWHVADPLDLRRMGAAADPLLGEHDFRAFCRRAPGTSPDEPITRRVLSAGWAEAEDREVAEAGPGRLLRFDITAQSFCHQMVRSIVATLVEVGRGRLHQAEVVERLRAGTRTGGPRPAPAEGLCLVEVAYG